jgi:hypothetical protein
MGWTEYLASSVPLRKSIRMPEYRSQHDVTCTKHSKPNLPAASQRNAFDAFIDIAINNIVLMTSGTAKANYRCIDAALHEALRCSEPLDEYDEAIVAFNDARRALFEELVRAAFGKFDKDVVASMRRMAVESLECVRYALKPCTEVDVILRENGNAT